MCRIGIYKTGNVENTDLQGVTVCAICTTPHLVIVDKTNRLYALQNKTEQKTEINVGLLFIRGIETVAFIF